MVINLNDKGICGTCIYRSDCLYLKNNMKEGKTVLHCNEFEDSAFRKEGESLFSCNSFVPVSCFSIKSVIPG